MKFHRLEFAVSIITLAILTAGCSSTESKPKESTPEASAAAQTQTKEPVLYTGQEALNRMMGLALRWSTDAQPARLESVLTPETSGQEGKSTVWRGYFVSPSRRSTKTIVCSGSRRPDAPPYGVSAEGE
jgi:starvation-inducible outer membrane lipoprotein